MTFTDSFMDNTCTCSAVVNRECARGQAPFYPLPQPLTLHPWASPGGCRGECSPLEFESDDVICSSQQIALIFSLAPSALAIIAPKVSLKRQKITKILTFCPQRVKNRQYFLTQFALNVFNFVLTTKNLQKLTVFSFLCKIEKGIFG